MAKRLECGSRFAGCRGAGAVRLLLGSSVSLVLAGCQGVTGSTVMPQVRIVHAAAGTASVDVYQGSGSVAYNLRYGNVTSYIAVGVGTDDFSAIASGTHEVVSTTRAGFAPYGSYTVVLGNSPGGPRETVLKDQATPVAGGRAAFRVVHQALSAGAVDVYLIPAGAAGSAGSVALGSYASGSSSEYVTVPAGGYRVVLYPGGVLPGSGATPVYSGALTVLGSGSAHTVILLDGKNGGGSSMQAIALTDVDTAG